MPPFKCERCGACCKWEGPVRLKEPEIDFIASFLRMPSEDFIRRYTVLAPDRSCLSLTERDDGSCIFYEDERRGCQIDPVKPSQCKDFPVRWSFPGWDSLCEAGRRMRGYNACIFTPKDVE